MTVAKKELKNKIETVKLALENKGAEIAAKQVAIECFDKEEHFDEEQYNDMLDENGMVDICGMQFVASRALKILDETAYLCGLGDFIDGMENDEFEEYRELESELEELE